MKYLVQLRRGTKAQWQAYEQQATHSKPLEGELAIEYDEEYILASTFEANTTYYISSNNVYAAANPQPTSANFSSGTYYKKKVTPRLKIGNGVDEFSNLPYMSVDSFILPKPASITLIGGDAWIQDSTDRFHQVVTVNNATITANSKVDLQPSPEQLCTFHEKDVAFTTVNENGVVTVYAVGIKPTNNYTLQATVTEVVLS